MPVIVLAKLVLLDK